MRKGTPKKGEKRKYFTIERGGPDAQRGGGKGQAGGHPTVRKTINAVEGDGWEHLRGENGVRERKRKRRWAQTSTV
mgnify:CR=1 FL=1